MSNAPALSPDNPWDRFQLETETMCTRPASKWAAAAILAAATVASSLPAAAQLPAERLLFQPNLQTDLRPTLESPMTLGVRGKLQAPAPVWTRDGLWATRPERLWGLARAQAAGLPTWDPSTRAWYAWALGALVEVRPDGSLPVVLDSLPGHDFDLRAAQGLVVYRDPARDAIVLQRLDGAREQRVLLSGWRFFNPRFSPDGKRVVVSESRSQGGHLWLVPLEGGAPRDLGRGNEPAWHPDGKRIVFTRFENDGKRRTSSTLLSLDLRTGLTVRLAFSREPVLARPTISPDGSWIALADDDTGEVVLAPLPLKEGR